jgi:hypothetical protein
VREKENISFKIQNKSEYPLSPLLISTMPEFLARAIRQQKEIEGIK